MRNRQVQLISRPTGVAQKEHFAVVEGEVRLPDAGEILVRNRYLSVEPAMRGWIADVGNYSAPVPIGSVMRSLAAGEVIESRHPDFAPGDLLTGWFGWQEFATVAVDAVVRKVEETDLPLSLSLGVLGINGTTALLALTRIGQPRPGETVLVSTAAGAVGSVVGQIARLLGCRTVGITGSPSKVAACTDKFGYDAAVDYRAPGLAEAIGRHCPDGVHVYFDNVSGAISDTVYPQLAQGARVVVCGTASVPDWSDWPSGPRVERHLLVKRARMEGFVIFDHASDIPEAIARLAAWVRSGELRYEEDILEEIEAARDALAGLYRGENHGKRLIRL